MLVATQLSVPGLYLPPCSKGRYSRHLRPRRSFHCRSKAQYDGLGQKVR